MSTQVKMRRGTAAQHASFTGAEAEVTFDQTNKTLRAHDGATAGGFLIATQAWVALQLTGSVADGSLTPAKFADTTQNTALGRVASGSGAPKWMTSAEQRQAAGISTQGSNIVTSTDLPGALAAFGASALLLAMWSHAR
jgi:hypothetical protein